MFQDDQRLSPHQTVGIVHIPSISAYRNGYHDFFAYQLAAMKCGAVNLKQS